MRISRPVSLFRRPLAALLSLSILGAPATGASSLDLRGDERRVSIQTLAPDLLHQQKSVWTSPLRLRENWPWALGVGAATGGLIAIDPKAAYFRRTSRFRAFNEHLSGTNTAAATVAAPVLWYGVGVLRHDDFAKETSLLAGEALVTTQIVVTALKLAIGRKRPSDIDPDGDFSSTFFKKHKTSASFPSGHAIAAFSVATVFSERYHDHVWVPYAAYGLATAVGFSRLTLQSHFPSDVFAGAALGYLISKYAVLRW